MTEKMIVTPWEVKGEIDYNKLIKEFGSKSLTDDLIARLKKHTKDLHLLLRRKIFFSHRDFNWILDEYEKGNKFYLYTGRGPSGHTHLGHLIPWFLTKWLQYKFKTKLYFQLTDDEKFLFNPKLSIEETQKFAYENALDIIALGFDQKRTFIFSDINYAKTLYKEAIKIAKKLTFSTTKAVFGFTSESNVGQMFFTSMQSVPCFLESVKAGKNVPCLIPLAMDQDPHFRITRDIAPKLGYYKPAIIHSKFLPGLGRGGKMSATEPATCIFTTDGQEQIERKISNAFTGGAATIAEQKRLGGNPDICSIYQYYYFAFEPDDKKVKELKEKCKAGEIMCGECKKELANRIKKFIAEHQKKREQAKKVIDKFILSD